MYFTVKNSQRICIFAGLFLLLFAFTGCQDEHIFRYGTTQPKPFGNSFLVIGDNRSGHRIYMDIVDSITASSSSSSCLINVGDMIEDPGNKAQWRKFLEMTAPIAEIMPWYAVVGNHDVNSISSQQIYQSVIGPPSNQLYYSFDLINSHFIVLDTEIPGQVGGIVGEQLAWLRNDLQTYADSTQHLFVFTHRPVYPQAHYRGRDLANADELHQLFTQYGVDAVFSGHEHQYYIYQKDSMNYVVTGGGGAPIYSGGIGESYHHYLLVELLPPNGILIHVLDVHGRAIKTDVITTN
jgi:3',5'-cyclic AMP phosphodiesterase CpdA